MPDEPAGGADRVELGVGEVAAGRAQRVGARVRGDQRRQLEPRDVPEAGLVEVAEVDGDPQLGAAAHEPRARRASAPGRCRASSGSANGTPWANAFGRLQTGPSERRPAACSSSSACRPGSTASAPSTCATAASDAGRARGVEVPGRAGDRRRGPRARARSRRPSVRATSAGRERPGRSARSSGSPRRGGSSRAGVAVKAAKIPPPRPPARARGRSMCPPSRPVAKSSASSRVSVSLCPSKTVSTAACHGAPPRATTGGARSAGQPTRRRGVDPVQRVASVVAVSRSRAGIVLSAMPARTATAAERAGSPRPPRRSRPSRRRRRRAARG